jgi:hypothetical protein
MFSATSQVILEAAIGEGEEHGDARSLERRADMEVSRSEGFEL